VSSKHYTAIQGRGLGEHRGRDGIAADYILSHYRCHRRQAAGRN